MTVLVATGHRPHKLGGNTPRVRLALGGLATEYLSRERPAQVITGMALGWDLAVAGACVALDIPFVAAVPFEGQEIRWPDDAQTRYRDMLAAASDVQIVSPWRCSSAYQARNEWMVDRGDKLVALWDGSWGGTFNCVKCAQKRGLPIDQLWERWTLDEEARALVGSEGLP